MPRPRKSYEKWEKSYEKWEKSYENEEPFCKKGKKLRKKRVMPLELSTEDVDGDIAVSALRAIKPLRSLAKTTKKSKGENPYRDEWRDKQFEGVGKPLDKLQEEKVLLLEDEEDDDIAMAACEALTLDELGEDHEEAQGDNPYHDELEDKQLQGVGQSSGGEFQAKSSELKVVIKKLPASLTPQEVEDELLSLGYPVLRVFQMRTGADKKLIPRFLVHLEQIPNTSMNIYQLKTLFDRRIDVEKYKKPQRILQCKRCQSFFHHSKSCCLPLRCLKCSREHLSADCTKPRNAPATFAHCGGPHPANYYGCPNFPKELQRSIVSKRGSKKGASEALSKRQSRRSEQTCQVIDPSTRQLESHLASIAISQKALPKKQSRRTEQTCQVIDPSIRQLESHLASIAISQKALPKKQSRRVKQTCQVIDPSTRQLESHMASIAISQKALPKKQSRRVKQTCQAVDSSARLSQLESRGVDRHM